MHCYRDESTFSHALCKAMKDSGWFVQRIESGTTGRGIPDIFAIAPTGACLWLELKRVHRKPAGINNVPWRPGQQSWLRKVTRATRHIKCYTVVAFDNCIGLIEHYQHHKENTVYMDDIQRVRDIKELLHEIG